MRSAVRVLLLGMVAAGCVGTEPAVDGRSAPLADAWLLDVEATGTWTDPASPDALFAWIDVRVANTRYHKRILIDVVAPYGDGVFMRTLSPATYKADLGGGYERWGSDAIELYPDAGPDGRSLIGPVAVRARIQHDGDGDGSDEMLATPWRHLYGDGPLHLPSDDVWAGLHSPVRASGVEARPAVMFSPFDDPGRTVLERIDALIARKRAAPASRHTLHAAVFNINDPEIVSKLIEAHEAGVEVRVVIDGRKLRPWYGWHTGDDRLLAAGVPVIGVKYAGSGAMHTKIALFDGERVATGSFNWEWGARFENHENMIVSRDAELVAAYARRFEVLAGGVHQPREHAIDSLSFAPDEAPYRQVGRVIDGARDELLVAMFTAKDVAYTEDGQSTSLHRKLVAAVERGVDVRLIVDYGIHEAAEFHGIETPDDPSDEWLEQRGVRVIRADNPLGPYASMHHKFVVADRVTVVTGAFNWYYDAAFANDEDQLVIRDAATAAVFAGEFADLSRRYDPGYDATDWPQVRVDLAVEHAGTLWGDSVSLVGDAAVAGNWAPEAGLPLDATDWPVWRGSLTLPAGTRLRCKLVVRGRDDNVYWEPGRDRVLTAPTSSGQIQLRWGETR